MFFVIIGSVVFYCDFECIIKECVVKFIGGCFFIFFGVFFIMSGWFCYDDEDEVVFFDVEGIEEIIGFFN